jgi:hypothetical protein
VNAAVNLRIAYNSENCMTSCATDKFQESLYPFLLKDVFANKQICTGDRLKGHNFGARILTSGFVEYRGLTVVVPVARICMGPIGEYLLTNLV